MITLQNITLRRGKNVLLQDVNWTIYHKQHIGLIGANGSGKSSLFAMLLRQLEADAGEISFPKQLSIAHVSQETPAYSKSALDFVLDGDPELRALEQELTIAEEQNDGERIATIHEQLGIIDAYTANARAATLLDGLGFNFQEQQQSVSSFSGGWRVRLNLAKALMCRSDVLLLDEPTNHLDLDAVIWLEKWLMNYNGTLLLISHDRDFLDNIVDHIAHIEQETLTPYAGNYSSFEQQRATRLMLQQAAFEKQQKKLAHMRSFVDRFKAKASKATQAQSRLKAIERMELVSAVHVDSPFQFEFKTPKRSPNPLIRLDDAVIAYGEKIVLTDLGITLGPKDRIGILGPNGAGKTSFIKLLAGELTQKSGVREVGAGLCIGYFAQHQVDHLNLNETPLDHLQEIAPNTSEQQLRSYLGTFGFPGDTVFEPVKSFSGGEKSRLALSFIIWQQPNLLLLDEPTNHLDLEMREALSMALQEYEGAMLLVSHDRFLVRSTVDQLYLVADHQLQEFKGDLNDYEKWLLDYRNQAARAQRKERETPSAKKTPRPSEQKIKQLEEEIVKLEKELIPIEMALADSNIYQSQNRADLQEYLAKQTDIKSRLSVAEKAWLAIYESKNE